MNVDEVKKTIRLGNDASGHGLETLERALAEATEAGALARAAAHDSGHETVSGMNAKLDSLEREVEIAVRRFQDAVEQADAYLDTI